MCRLTLALRYVQGNVYLGYYGTTPFFVHTHHLKYILYYSFDLVKCFSLFIYKTLKK